MCKVGVCGSSRATDARHTDSITHPYGETDTNSINKRIFDVTKEKNVTRKEIIERYSQQVMVCSIPIS